MSAGRGRDGILERGHEPARAFHPMSKRRGLYGKQKVRRIFEPQI